MVASVTGGGASARHEIAYDFGVDPNTSFPPLHEELTRLATGNVIGETTTGAGLAFVSGGAERPISASRRPEREPGCPLKRRARPQQTLPLLLGPP